jgi:hypothetical protein
MATGIIPYRPVATVILISSRYSGITRTRCYCDIYIYSMMYLYKDHEIIHKHLVSSGFVGN